MFLIVSICHFFRITLYDHSRTRFSCIWCILSGSTDNYCRRYYFLYSTSNSFMFCQSDISLGTILSTKYHTDTKQFLYDDSVRMQCFSIENERFIEFRFCHVNSSESTSINFSLKNVMQKPLIMSIIVGCITLLSGYIRVIFSNISAERQVRTIRQKLFQSILHQDIAFFDQHPSGELNLYLTENINKISHGIGDKLTAATEMIATFISCLVVGKVSSVFKFIKKKK